MTTIRYEKRKLADLVPDHANPREISPEARAALSASVSRFGLVQPLVLNERTGKMVGGHQRLAVLKEQGIVEVDVAIGSWTEAEERALNVALNNPAAQGTFTLDLGKYLESSLSALTLSDFRALRFDELAFDKPRAKAKKDRGARGLEYKLVIECADEVQQSDLLERLEAEGLTVKVVIV